MCVYRLAHRMFTQQVHIHNNALNFLRLPFKSFSTFLCFYFSIRVGIGPVGREKDKISSRSGSVATTTTSFQRFPRAIKFLLSSSMLYSFIQMAFVCQLSASFSPLPVDGCQSCWVSSISFCIASSTLFIVRQSPLGIWQLGLAWSCLRKFAIQLLSCVLMRRRRWGVMQVVALRREERVVVCVISISFGKWKGARKTRRNEAEMERPSQIIRARFHAKFFWLPYIFLFF